MKRQLFCGYFGKKIAWFRIFGYGLSIKNTHEYPLLFSERHGYRKGLQLGHYIIHGLS